MINKIKFLLISLVMFFSLTLPVYANNTADLSKTGSIEVILKEGTDNMISGGEITIYHIADAIDVNNNLAYQIKDELGECNVDLSDITRQELVDEISKCNLDNANKYNGITDTFGSVKFNDLKLGLYYIKQTKGVKGYSNIDPFVVGIPTVEDNKWVYDVFAKPKTDIFKVIDITIKKEWNVRNTKLPESVTIQLYNDLELVDTVILNKDNNWTYTFIDLKLSDKYNVKEIDVPKGFTPSYKEDNYVFTVTNTDILAQTGQIFYPIIILSILGVVFILVGIKLIKNEA
jgi:hypothetical protein